MKITLKEMLELHELIKANYQPEFYLPPKSVGGEPGEEDTCSCHPCRFRRENLSAEDCHKGDQRVLELEEQLREVNAHFKKNAEEWDKFLNQAIPEQELLDERFCNGPKPIPPKLADLYPLTRKQFQEWREKHVENYLELESLRAKVARMESAPYKQALDFKVQAVLDAVKKYVGADANPGLNLDQLSNPYGQLVKAVRALEETP